MIQGLSCVESHVLSLMDEAGWNPVCAYAGSLVSFSELYAYFVVENRPYAYFDRAVKAQDWLKSVGSLSIVRRPARLLLDDASPNGRRLVSLSQDGMLRLFGKTPWRPDHYVWALPQKGQVLLFDDIQPSPVALDREALIPFLQENGLDVRLLQPPSEEAKTAFRQALAQKAKTILLTPGEVSAPASVSAHPERARDMLGMSRQLARRLICLLESEGGAFSSLRQGCREMDHMYAKLQYAILRRREPEQFIISALREIREAARTLAQAFAG